MYALPFALFGVSVSERSEFFLQSVIGSAKLLTQAGIEAGCNLQKRVLEFKLQFGSRLARQSYCEYGAARFPRSSLIEVRHKRQDSFSHATTKLKFEL